MSKKCHFNDFLNFFDDSFPTWLMIIFDYNYKVVTLLRHISIMVENSVENALFATVFLQ